MIQKEPIPIRSGVCSYYNHNKKRKRIMNTIAPIINTDLASGVKQICTHGKMISLEFTSPGTKIYKPRVSVYSEVDALPSTRRVASIDGSPYLTIPVGGDYGTQPVDVIFEDGVIDMRMVSEHAPNAPWWENSVVRCHFTGEGHWVPLCGLKFFFNGSGVFNFNRDSYTDHTGMDNPGTYIAWDGSSEGDSIRIEARITLDDMSLLTFDKKIYFRLDFDCDESSNHTHTKWGILTLKKDPVSSINITWYVS